MKKILLLAFISALFLGSCSKKGGTDSKYYVKLKINGAWVTWTTVAGEIGPNLADPSETVFGITANNDDQSDVFDVTIALDGINFPAGSYTTDDGDYTALVHYLKEVSGNMYLYTNANAPSMPDSKHTINITSITDTEVRGNIVGNYLYCDDNDQVMTISEVEFYVERLR